MNLRLPLAAAIIAYCQAGQADSEVFIVDPLDFPNSLNNAIDSADPSGGPTEIEFPPGIYTLAPNDTPTPAFAAGANITFRGRNNSTWTIDGNGFTGRGFEVGNGSQATFEGMTLSGFNGPGIMIQTDAEATITDSTISGNNSPTDGGGIFNKGDLTLRDSTISGNTTTGEGGGIYSYSNQLYIDNSTFSGNTATGDGGGFYGKTGPGDDRIELRNVTFSGNTAGIDGGGLSFDLDDTSGADRILLHDLIIIDNRAGNNGGGLDILGGGSNDDFRVRNCRFEGNQAAVFGIDFNILGWKDGPGPLVQGCDFVGPNTVTRFENPDSRFSLADTIIEFDSSGPGGVDSTGTVNLLNVAFDDFVDELLVPRLASTPLASTQPVTAKTEAACNDFGFGTFQSLGNNISPDNSCNLNQPGDMPNTDARVGHDPGTGRLSLLPGSPAIDAGFTEVSVRVAGLGPLLPCGFKDANGLGRPQDGNGDGVFECDIGSVEVQGGPDMVAAQSSAYFDTSRNGEGVFVELIGNNQAVVAMFTYAVTGNIPTWLMGLGKVAGNSVVIDDLLKFDGGMFGAGFNAANISSTSVGGLSLVFPTCDSVSQPGKMAFQANPLRGFSDLLVNATRITNILDCNVVNMGAGVAGRSGAFFDPARSGEGIFVQWLSNGKVVVIWYTYDNQGNRLWISNDADRTTVNGTTVTATMVFPTGSTRFGQNFDASEVVLSDWGTITLGYQPGCNTLSFAYAATAPGFGSGNYNYQRLTKLDGTTCDL